MLCTRIVDSFVYLLLVSCVNKGYRKYLFSRQSSVLEGVLTSKDDTMSSKLSSFQATTEFLQDQQLMDVISGMFQLLNMSSHLGKCKQ